MLQKSFFYQSLAVIIAGLALTAVVAFAWTEPSLIPPGGNVAAPLNIGTVGQVKSGGLGVAWDQPKGNIGFFVLYGNVGIGTSAPGDKLTISTAASLDGIRVTDGTRWTKLMSGTVGSGSYNGIVQANDNALIYSGGAQGTGSFVIAPWSTSTSGIRMNASGNVGIGTTAPDFRLQIKSNVYQSGGGTEDRTIAIQTVANVPMPTGTSTYYAPANNSPGINFLNSNGSFLGALGLSGWSGAWGGSAQPRDISLGAYDGYLVLRAGHTPGVDSLIGRVFINPASGNVGVGIAEPTALLDVNGQIRIRGGNPGANKVLTSDANGLATWKTLGADGVLTSNTTNLATWQNPASASSLRSGKVCVPDPDTTHVNFSPSFSNGATSVVVNIVLDSPGREVDFAGDNKYRVKNLDKNGFSLLSSNQVQGNLCYFYIATGY